MRHIQRHDCSEFREHLEKKAHELARELCDRASIEVERASDAIDQQGLAIEREWGARTLEARTDLLQQVRAALQRLEQGTYGACVDCAEPISWKRLKAVPWAARCVACQEREDQNQKPFFAAA